MIYIAVTPVGSKFAKALQGALKELGEKCTRVSVERGLFHAARGKKVFFVTQNVLNKVQQFNAFNEHNVRCPRSAQTVEGARALDCKTLFARTTVTGTNGRGIVEFEHSAEEYPPAPLYTEYIPKKKEFRVHVFDGKVIDVQQKKKREGVETWNSRIRNLANGYIYARNNVDPPEGLGALAILAVESVGYRYGAVDIIWNEKQNQCYVLEVNSRPGLEGTTVVKYAEAIKEAYQ